MLTEFIELYTRGLKTLIYLKKFVTIDCLNLVLFERHTRAAMHALPFGRRTETCPTLEVPLAGRNTFKKKLDLNN